MVLLRCLLLGEVFALMNFRSKALWGIVLASIIGYYLASGSSEVLDSYFHFNGWVKVGIALAFLLVFGRRILK